MSVNRKALSAIAKNLDSYCETRIGKFVQFGKSAFSFEFAKGKFLIIDLDNRDPSLYLDSSFEPIQNLQSTLSSLLRKRLSGSLVTKVSTINDDRVIRFNISTTNAIYEKVAFALIIELIPTKANLCLLDENDVVLACLRPNTLLDERPLLHGIHYEPPLRKGNPQGEDEEFDVEMYFRMKASSSGEVFQRARKAQYDLLFKTLKSKIKSLRRKINKIDEDIAKAEAHLNDGDYGTYIFTYQDSIHHGDDSFDYYGTKVQLDPLKSPSQNAEAFFQRAKKSKATIVMGKANKQKAESELEEMTSLLLLSESCDYEALDSIAESIGLKAQGKGNKKTQSHFKMPHILLIDNIKYAIGRNAKENEFLTFSYAKSSEFLWFHVKDRPGSHVILMKDDPTNEEITIACELALLGSKLPDGEVLYAKRGTLKKGDFTGQVVLSEYHSYYLREISPKTKAIYSKIGEGCE